MTRRIVNFAFALFIGAAVIGTAYYGYRQWQAQRTGSAADSAKKRAAPIVDGSMPARLSAQARANLGLVVEPIKAATYWRKIEVPGFLIDRPGVSDRGVIAPVTGVVTECYSHPGETVEPNAPLFKLRLISDTLHASQRELFKAMQEIEIAQSQMRRLSGLVESGTEPRARIIGIENQIQRADATVKAYRQELLARGLSSDEIDEAAKGKFVTEITVRAPEEKTLHTPELALVSAEPSPDGTQRPFRFELQGLNVALGQQANAGEVLCHLADHRSLLVEGRGFKEDMPLIQQAAKNGLPIELDFEERKGLVWPVFPQQLRIHHVQNTIDTQTRTFGFYLILENQWQTYVREGHTGLLWRFRPGDRVRLRVAVEKFENVFVLPQAAVVREGPEAYTFRQNGDLFDRRPVHVLAEDRSSVVIANDGSVKPGTYLAQNAAASINRVLKAQLASGQPTNVHVHADGTVHAAH